MVGGAIRPYLNTSSGGRICRPVSRNANELCATGGTGGGLLPVAEIGIVALGPLDEALY